MESDDTLEKISCEDRRTPKPRTSSVTVSYTVNELSELHLLESPMSSSYYGN